MKYFDKKKDKFNDLFFLKKAYSLRIVTTSRSLIDLHQET
jgi:hypothetical protein